MVYSYGRMARIRSKCAAATRSTVNRATGGKDRGNARRIDLCLPALALSPLSSPRLHGRTPTIPPAFSNARRSTIRQPPLRAGGIIPPGKRKTRPESAPAAAATIIASGAIHGRNHAEPIVHLISLQNPADCRHAEWRCHLSCKALPSGGAMRAWSSEMKDRTADDVLMPFATLCAEGVFDICS